MGQQQAEDEVWVEWETECFDKDYSTEEALTYSIFSPNLTLSFDALP